jgi:hypothetical protein
MNFYSNMLTNLKQSMYIIIPFIANILIMLFYFDFLTYLKLGLHLKLIFIFYFEIFSIFNIIIAQLYQTF